MRAVSRRETCLIGGVSSKSSLVLLAFFICAVTSSMADTRPAAPDFYTWLASEQGQKASLAQMKQQCAKVLDAEENLNCSVSVLARMFEAKTANQIPEYYLAIKRRHAQAIANDPELNAMFSMFGSESLATLRAVGDFSVTRAKRHEVLVIHPYASDGHATDEVLPYLDVKAANGVSSRFILDSGAPQTESTTKPRS